MLKGEIWRVNLPDPTGHAQAGHRPAVIVQNDASTSLLPTVLIVPFTGSQGAQRYPGTVLVQPDVQNGLTGPSVALVFQVRALDKRRCVKHLGELDTATLDQILDALEDLTR